MGEPAFEKYDHEYSMLQQKMKGILQKEDDLQEIVQLVGKDSLSEDQKCTLEVVKIIREDFLQQNGFTDYDFMCPLAKTIGMMRVIVTFHEAAQKVIAESTGEQKITWNQIYNNPSLRSMHTEVTKMILTCRGSQKRGSRRSLESSMTRSPQRSAPWLRRSDAPDHT